MIKVLNLYSGIGGNRKLWQDVEVTAIENNPQIAKIYQDLFPQDKVIVTDAHQYLLEHFEEYDFIWSSPPCPTHSRVRFMGTLAPHPTCGTIIPKAYADMRLYEEIILLTSYFKGKWCVENVIGYYEPLIKPQEVGKHYFWTNFPLSNIKIKSRKHNATISEMQEYKGFDLSNVELDHRKDVILRNCIEPKLGLLVLNCAYKNKQIQLNEVMVDKNAVAVVTTDGIPPQVKTCGILPTIL